MLTILTESISGYIIDAVAYSYLSEQMRERLPAQVACSYVPFLFVVGTQIKLVRYDWLSMRKKEICYALHISSLSRLSRLR